MNLIGCIFWWGNSFFTVAEGWNHRKKSDQDETRKVIARKVISIRSIILSGLVSYSLSIGWNYWVILIKTSPKPNTCDLSLKSYTLFSRWFRTFFVVARCFHHSAFENVFKKLLTSIFKSVAVRISYIRGRFAEKNPPLSIDKPCIPFTYDVYVVVYTYFIGRFHWI